MRTLMRRTLLFTRTFVFMFGEEAGNLRIYKMKKKPSSVDEFVIDCYYAPGMVCFPWNNFYIISFLIQCAVLYMFIVRRAFMAGVTSQAGDADSS